ncbi:succinylglutamate desuccinylase/aspartoacylase domain-containing protein, partial [Teichococcus cervicalis]
MSGPGGPALLPHFPVELPVPDLRDLLAGNTLPGVWSFAAEAPGPHVALCALIHGNEIAGALLLARWLREGLRPARGRLTLIFANLAAFSRFDPADPTLSRFVDEDLNRVWCDRVLDGPRRSTELDRARALRPLIGTVDVLLDLHSMLWPSDPLILAGAPAGQALARRLGQPPLVVADGQGHASGRRLIDHSRFTDPAAPRPALLVEAGQHWERRTLAVMEAAATALLHE